MNSSRTQNPHWNWKALGAWLRQQRKSAAKSQEDLAQALDVAFQQVQKYENGANRIPVDKLVIWCRQCCCNIQGAIEAAEKGSAS